MSALRRKRPTIGSLFACLSGSTPLHFYPRDHPPPVPALWIRNIPTGSAQQQAVAEHIAVVISDITDHTRGQQGASRPAAFPPLNSNQSGQKFLNRVGDSSV